MHRFAASIVLGLASLALCAFTDLDGIFGIDVDPDWRMVGKSGSDTFHFAPEGDRTLGGLIVGAYPADLPSLHDQIVENFGPDARFGREAPGVVFGKDCIYADTRQITPGGVPLVAHHLYCTLTTTRSDSSKYVFAMSVISPMPEAKEFTAVFWHALRTIRWGPSVK
jgi:hypothetical protein